MFYNDLSHEYTQKNRHYQFKGCMRTAQYLSSPTFTPTSKAAIECIREFSFSCS